MIKEFTYPVPDDAFVEGVSGKRKVSYTYEGPEKFLVLVNSDGLVYKVDPNVEELTEKENEELVEIDANKNPEVAFFFGHTLLDVFEYTYDFDEEVLDNGDIYKFTKNPLLWDVYYVIYNRTTSSWEFKQVLKPTYVPGEEIVKVRLKLIKYYLETYSFSPEIESQLLEYSEQLNDYILNTPGIFEWKYNNLPKANIPKIPAAIAAEINKLPGGNLE
jgi:hypothetical protein